MEAFELEEGRDGGIGARPPNRTASVDSGDVVRSATWLKANAPFLPKLVNFDNVIPIFDEFKREFYELLDQALHYLFSRQPELRGIAPLELWRWCAAAEKYGAIYLMSRREAARLAPELSCRSETLRRIARIMRADDLSTRLINFAVCAWVHSREERRNYSKIRLPKNGIMSAGGDAIYVNRKDFSGVSPPQAFEQSLVLYDLHDFVHQVCSRVSGELYGCQYFGVFSTFDRSLQALVRDHRHACEQPNLFGDSLMFRQLSLGLFDSLHHSSLSDRELVNVMSEALSLYLRKEKSLLQPATGRWLRAEEILGAKSLAILSQNKAYEHTASECEELLFVRGGNGTADALTAYDTPERIRAMANAPLNYHERRNFLRHRAHKRAYLLHAHYLRNQVLATSTASTFLDEIIDNLCFADHVSGRRLDLFNRVSELDDALEN